MLVDVPSMEGLGICCEAFAENDTAIHLARPLNPTDMTVTKANVEFDEMRGLFGGVYSELGKARLIGPLLDTL